MGDAFYFPPLFSPQPPKCATYWLSFFSRKSLPRFSAATSPLTISSLSPAPGTRRPLFMRSFTDRTPPGPSRLVPGGRGGLPSFPAKEYTYRDRRRKRGDSLTFAPKRPAFMKGGGKHFLLEKQNKSKRERLALLLSPFFWLRFLCLPFCVQT